MPRRAACGNSSSGAGNEYGLKQTPYTDDRMDPEKATRAAARHLHDLYNEFGDWYLAIAAYNCGPITVEKAVERTGYADFWELRSRGVLPAETTNYVPIILAMTIMEKNAAEYGLDHLQYDPPLQFDTVETLGAYQPGVGRRYHRHDSVGVGIFESRGAPRDRTGKLLAACTEGQRESVDGHIADGACRTAHCLADA